MSDIGDGLAAVMKVYLGCAAVVFVVAMIVVATVTWFVAKAVQ